MHMHAIPDKNVLANQLRRSSVCPRDGATQNTCCWDTSHGIPRGLYSGLVPRSSSGKRGVRIPATDAEVCVRILRTRAVDKGRVMVTLLELMLAPAETPTYYFPVP